MAIRKAKKRNIELAELSNGMKIVTESMSHVRSVSVGIWLDGGSRNEIGEENGISHFIEHMVFKGTAKRSAEDIARAVDSLGGNLDAFTGKELVSFNVKVLDEHLPEAFDILADMVLRPAFRTDDIEKEKGVILEELKMEVDNPEYLVHETFISNFWRGHPLGKSILGTKDTIRGFDRKSIGKFYRETYLPSNLLITAAGNLKHGELVEMADREFGKLKPRRRRAPLDTPRSTARIILKDKGALEQAHVMLGVPGYPVDHPKRFAVYVLNTLLGGGMSSRLFQNIREQRGLAYSVFSDLSSYRDSGALTIYAGTSRAAIPQVVELVMAELRNFKQNPVGAEELKRGKNHLKGSVMLGLESSSSRMSNLARQQLYFGRFISMDEVVRQVDAVTTEQIQEVAAEMFRPEAVALTVLGPLGGLKLGRELLHC